MNSWTEAYAIGHHRWQTLLEEAEKNRQVKRAATQLHLLHWLRRQLKSEMKRSHSGQLRPLKARE